MVSLGIIICMPIIPTYINIISFNGSLCTHQKYKKLIYCNSVSLSFVLLLPHLFLTHDTNITLEWYYFWFNHTFVEIRRKEQLFCSSYSHIYHFWWFSHFPLKFFLSISYSSDLWRTNSPRFYHEMSLCQPHFWRLFLMGTECGADSVLNISLVLMRNVHHAYRLLPYWSSVPSLHTSPFWNFQLFLSNNHLINNHLINKYPRRSI